MGRSGRDRSLRSCDEFSQGEGELLEDDNEICRSIGIGTGASSGVGDTNSAGPALVRLRAHGRSSVLRT